MRNLVIRVDFVVAGIGSPYRAPNGQMTAGTQMAPRAAITNARAELFIPYDELSLRVPGRYDLRFHVEVQYSNGFGWIPLAITSPDRDVYFSLTQR
jgi:hypothetical protein